MKMAFFVFALTFLVSLPAFSSLPVMTPEEDAKDAIATNAEVDELNRLVDEEEMMNIESTVGNDMPVETPVEQTTL